MNREHSLFVSWLRSHYRLGQFDRRDQWGQLDLSRFDEIVVFKMHVMDLEEKRDRRSDRYEEMAYLLAVFSSNPAAKDVFLGMFPHYNQEGEEDIEFIVPDSSEAVQDLLAEVREMGLFPDTK